MYHSLKTRCMTRPYVTLFWSPHCSIHDTPIILYFLHYWIFIQEYVTGQEYAVDTVSKDGEIKVHSRGEQWILSFVLDLSVSAACLYPNVWDFTVNFGRNISMLCYCYLTSTITDSGATILITLILPTTWFHSTGSGPVALSQESSKWGPVRLWVFWIGAMCIRGRTNGDQ